MHALVVVESVFGNTRLIAGAVARGLTEGLEEGSGVRTVDVAEAPTDLDGIDLLIVGGPTHAFSMTRASTRRSAVEQHGATVVGEVGLREWIETLPAGGGRAVATFDTRTERPRLPGSAAAAAAKRLRSRGYRMVERPASFRVQGTRGPLVGGQVERAEAWGRALAARLVAAPAR